MITRHRGLPITLLTLILAAKPAWATLPATMPGPGLGLLAGIAIIAGLVIAKLWLRK